jgi:hypothetical protein
MGEDQGLAPAARSGRLLMAAWGDKWRSSISSQASLVSTPSIVADFKRTDPMKLILTLLGVVLLIVAAVYFLVPADQLPGVFPGHETGLARIRAKHGIASGLAGVVLLVAGIWMGRK